MLLQTKDQLLFILENCYRMTTDFIWVQISAMINNIREYDKHVGRNPVTD